MTYKKESRVSVYTKAGLYITDIDASVERSWKMSDYGEGSFSISIRDVKAYYEHLRFGNLILIEHNKLPLWGGIIDYPRRWNMRNYAIDISAYTAEHILKSTRLPKTFTPVGKPVVIIQEIFKRIQTDARITYGILSEGGDVQKPEYHYDTAYDAITTLCEEAEMEFNIIPEVDATGRLYFVFNLFERYGMGVTSPIKLLEGKNIALTDEPIIEDGPIYNDVIGYGEGATWGDKITENRIDAESIGEYGIRMSSFSVKSKVKADIVEATIAEINLSKNPTLKFDINVLDVDNTMEDIQLGNKYDLEFYTCGFDGAGIGLSTTARVLGFAYNDSDMVLEMIMERYDG